MLKKVKRIKISKTAYRRLLKRVLERDSWRCQKCGAVKNLQVHHRQHRGQLGDDSLANLLTLCAYCTWKSTVNWLIRRRRCGR
jgi:hypothetical protein